MRKLLALLISGILACGCARNELADISRDFSRNDTGNERMILYRPKTGPVELSSGGSKSRILGFNEEVIERGAGKLAIAVHSHYPQCDELDYSNLTPEQIANIKSLDKETLENRLFIQIPSELDIRCHLDLQEIWWDKNWDSKLRSMILTMSIPRRIVEYGLTREAKARYHALWKAKTEADGDSEEFKIREKKLKEFVAEQIAIYFRLTHRYYQTCLKPWDGQNKGREPSVTDFGRILEPRGIYLKDLGRFNP